MEFTTVQLGLDVATSLAVTGSAAAFFINQAHKYKQSKRLQLDTSVRRWSTNNGKKPCINCHSVLSTMSCSLFKNSPIY